MFNGKMHTLIHMNKLGRFKFKNISFNNPNRIVNFNFCSKNDKDKILSDIIKDEQEETSQDKYKDFMNNIKQKEELRRRADKESLEVLKTLKMPYNKINKIVLQRNFMKRKKQSSDEVENNTEEVTIETLDQMINHTHTHTKENNQSILLFEIDSMCLAVYKSISDSSRIYLLLALLCNSAFYFNHKLLFMYTPLAYFLCYFANAGLLFAYFLNKKCKNRVLSIEYFHQKKSVIVKRFSLHNTKLVESKLYNVSDLALIYSREGRFMERGITLRSKIDSNEVLWLGMENEAIWHNLPLFEELFGKILIDKDENLEDIHENMDEVINGENNNE